MARGVLEREGRAAHGRAGGGISRCVSLKIARCVESVARRGASSSPPPLWSLWRGVRSEALCDRAGSLVTRTSHGQCCAAFYAPRSTRPLSLSVSLLFTLTLASPWDLKMETLSRVSPNLTDNIWRYTLDFRIQCAFRCSCSEIDVSYSESEYTYRRSDVII